jgi:hypothetical protein
MIEEILEQRQKIHGDFRQDATTAQAIKAIYHGSPNFGKLSPIQREALDHIATKIARILVGKADHQDHWEDIAGYAKLVSQRLNPQPSKLSMDDVQKIADRFKPEVAKK